MAAKFVLKKSAAAQPFHFVLKAANGETILSSENYAQKASALNGIESVKKNSPLDEHYERKVAKNGAPYFVLKAVNGQVIGNSEMYSTESARDHGIESVKKNGSIATVDDET